MTQFIFSLIMDSAAFENMLAMSNTLLSKNEKVLEVGVGSRKMH